MSQTKEENSQANLTQENSETEENTEEEAPEDEVDSQEEDSQEDTEEEDETDEEDMEGTEEHHQSEVEELVKAVAPPVKKDKAEKKQRPISVEPKKKFVDDVPKQQSPKKKQPVPKEQSPKKQRTTVDDVTVPPEEGCCGCKVPWARWEELIIAYLHIIIAVSSGLAGAGLSSVVQTFEDTFQNNRTLTPSGPLNSTDCESYLSDSIEIIVTVIYSVIVALFLAQVITLIVLGTQRRYKHANFVFLHLRALITLFTTVYFIVGWSGALGCVTLNILAIVTTMIEVVLTLIEYVKESKKLGIEFMKDCFPQALPGDDKDVEPLEVM